MTKMSFSTPLQANSAGMVAERLGRRWIGMELMEEYLEASKFRFG